MYAIEKYRTIPADDLSASSDIPSGVLQVNTSVNIQKDLHLIYLDNQESD